MQILNPFFMQTLAMGGVVITLLIVAALIVLPLLWLMSSYNALVKLRNRYKNAFAQIVIGRKILFNDQWGSSFSTGLNYSIFSHKIGTIFKDESENNYSDLSQTNYRKVGLVNLILQAEIYYLMTKNWEASFGLQASGSLNNSFQNNSDFLEKRKVGSLQVGLKKWF